MDLSTDLFGALDVDKNGVIDRNEFEDVSRHIETRQSLTQHQHQHQQRSQQSVGIGISYNDTATSGRNESSPLLQQRVHGEQPEQLSRPTPWPTGPQVRRFLRIS